jgi:hypothetical protein
MGLIYKRLFCFSGRTLMKAFVNHLNNKWGLCGLRDLHLKMERNLCTGTEQPIRWCTSRANNERTFGYRANWRKKSYSCQKPVAILSAFEWINCFHPNMAGLFLYLTYRIVIWRLDWNSGFISRPEGRLSREFFFITDYFNNILKSYLRIVHGPFLMHPSKVIHILWFGL